MTFCNMVFRATSPFRELPSPFSNSIQPSLKPSSIRIRGVGFFMPCDLNRGSQVSLARHGVHSYGTAKKFSEGGRNLVGRHPARPFQLDDTSAVPNSLEHFRGHTSDVGGGNHWYRFTKRLQKARNHTVLARCCNIPSGIFHEPSRSQED